MDDFEENTKKRAAPRRMGYLRRLLLLVCVAVLCFSGYHLVTGLLEYKKGTDLYDDIEHTYVSTPTPTPTPVPGAPTPTPVVTPTPPPLPEITGPEEEIPDDTPPPGPGEEDEDEPPSKPSKPEQLAPDIWPVVDFEGLLSVNPDTEAWIICPGTNINYPVVHSHDNADYLTTMFNLTYGRAGSLFIDMRNKYGFADRNTIIYGHNMRNHSMFWTLTRYKAQSYYNAHPTMRLILPDGNYELQLFAGFVAEESEGEVWRTKFASDEAFIDWIKAAFARSTFRSYVNLEESDHVVTLSTCSYEFTGARYVVMGKLVKVS
ncbi:MAG: class B sortase [Oscillospiraceae bacterium]|jgi:sortase B|nr:class B sortase [Oscillospiraceae bacterium]